jgi:hypothetical protein
MNGNGAVLIRNCTITSSKYDQGVSSPFATIANGTFNLDMVIVNQLNFSDSGTLIRISGSSQGIH